MKKTTVCFPVFALVFVVLLSPCSAQVNLGNEYLALQSKKDPLIDGLLDVDVWGNVPEEPVEAIYNDLIEPVYDRWDFSVNFRMMWKGEFLYIYLAVLDDELVTDETLATWQWDNIELYFDGDNSDGEGMYDGLNDIQLRWTWDEMDQVDGIDKGYGDADDWGFDTELIEWAMSVTDSGYNLEAAIAYEDLDIAPEEEFGFEIQVGDNDPDQDRVFFRWNWNGAGSFRQTINHGTVILVMDYVPEDTHVETEEPGLANDYVLLQNYPNPFNPVTTISYKLAEANSVTLQVINTAGEIVAILEKNSQKDAGTHTIRFDAENLSSGVYFYQLTVGDTGTLAKKMLLVK